MKVIRKMRKESWKKIAENLLSEHSIIITANKLEKLAKENGFKAKIMKKKTFFEKITHLK